MSEFEKNNEDNSKRVPARKKTFDLKAVAPLLEELNDETDSNISQFRKKDSLNISPNEELIQTTARIKNQRDLIHERLLKMDQSRTRVSKNVFEKVCRDYSMQLESITHLLNEKKAILKKELKNFYLQFEKKTLDINRHREILEEAQFRHYLDEFSEEQYKEVEEFESREINVLHGELSQIQAFIRIHEELFDPQDLGLSPKPPQPVISPDITKTIIPPVQAIITPGLQQPIQQPVAPLPQQVDFVQTRVPTEIPPQILKQSAQETVITPPVMRQPIVKEPEPNLQTTVPLSVPETENIFDEPESSFESIEAPQEIPEEIPELIEELSPENNYFEPSISSSPAIKTESSISKIIPEEKTNPKLKTEIPLEEELKPEHQSIMDILGDISLDEEISETHSHVANTPAYNVSNDEIHPAVSSNEHKLVFIEAEGPLDVNELVVRDNVSIGRSPSNDLVLKAAKVSRQHAAINKYKDQYLLIDLKSSNGVFVNGKKIEEHALVPGDEISIGGYKMIFKKS